MKLTDLSIKELRDVCNHAGWSCRDSNGRYMTKESLVLWLKSQGVTDPPDDGKKLWSAMFKQWVNEVIDYEGYRHRFC